MSDEIKNENTGEVDNNDGFTVTPNGSYFNDNKEPIKAEPVIEEPSIKEPVIEKINLENKEENFDIFMPKNKEKQKTRFSLSTIVISVALSLLVSIGGSFGVFYALNNADTKTDDDSSETTPQNVTNITVDKTASNVVEAVTQKAGPSVVGISTTAAVSNFFGGSSDSTDEGSGIIYSKDGYIITNYHVISAAVESSSSTISVYLPSNPDKGIKASVVGYNIASDLAVIKIDKKGLPAIELGNSKKLKVGQYAIAIGSPGGMEFMNSVSYGIISGLNRSLSVDNGSSMTLIQTDAAINPGNSGGALLDTNGKLIGVNSAKLVDTSFEGMGFAIPVNSVKEICDKIISKENDPTPYIGIEINQLYSAKDLTRLGYPEGAVVNNVTTGGPAAKSGVQRGDIITEFNGKAISDYKDLEDAIMDCTPGDSVTIKIYRAGRFYSTSVRVEANNAQ